MIAAGLRWRGHFGPMRWLKPHETKQTDFQKGSPWGPTATISAQENQRGLTTETADSVGAMLLRENHESVNFRYDEKPKITIGDPYRFKQPMKAIEPVQVLKAIACYEYQSCEHPGWEVSEAKEFCEALRIHAINSLPGYDDAAWGIDDKQPEPKTEIREILPVQRPEPEEDRELTKSEKISMDIKDIAKELRQKLKKRFPSSKFSVRIDRYSMGQSLTVSLMQSSTKVIQDFDKVPEVAIHDRANNHYSAEDIKEEQARRYHQLNHHGLKEEYDPNKWNNGVFLTKAGHDLLSKVVEIADHYNYDDSDIMTDYYSVNFSFSLHIGQWNKPYNGS
jgi:hypothetical protein